MVVSGRAAAAPIDQVELVGEPVVDFVNTGSRLLERYPDPAAAEARGYGPFTDRLTRYEDLVTWGERTGVLDAKTARAMRAAAAANPAAANATLSRARELREALYRILEAESRGVAPPGEDVTVLEGAAREAAVHRRLRRTRDGYRLDWPATAEVERVVWPVAVDAVSLLLSPERARVKRCASDDCNWLFVDASRNRSRRWCEMSACGNRAKARRFKAKR